MIDRTKTLLYWKENDTPWLYTKRYDRVSLNNRFSIWVIQFNNRNWEHMYSSRPFSSFEEAIFNADELMLQRNFMLLTKEQSDKYRVLL